MTDPSREAAYHPSQPATHPAGHPSSQRNPLLLFAAPHLSSATAPWRFQLAGGNDCWKPITFLICLFFYFDFVGLWTLSLWQRRLKFFFFFFFLTEKTLKKTRSVTCTLQGGPARLWPLYFVGHWKIRWDKGTFRLLLSFQTNWLQPHNHVKEVNSSSSSSLPPLLLNLSFSPFYSFPLWCSCEVNQNYFPRCSASTCIIVYVCLQCWV